MLEANIREPDNTKPRILFLDIETQPNVVFTWGLFKQNIGLDSIVDSGSTLCWAAKWDNDTDVDFSSVWGDGESVMLQRIHTLLNEADVVIHYNGKRFDIPTLNKEFIKFGLSPPDPYHQVDLLEVAKRRFRFTSNKLDYVAKFLGIGAKVQHKGMSLWKGCMAGNEKDQRKMQVYNKQDVRLLPKLYKKLLPWINNHPNMGLYTDREVVTCTNCGSTKVKKNGIEPLATQSYQRYRCNSCGTNLRGRHTILPIDKRKSVITQSKM